MGARALPAVASVSASEATLREVVETLAPIERPPCSEGERRAADWLVERLARAGVARVRVEEERGYGTFPPTMFAIGLLAAAGAALALRGRRAAAAAAALTSLAAFADEIENGPRVFRAALRRERTLANVVARTGPEEAERTLVVLAHHDAPQTGAIFDQGLQRKAFELAPEFMDRFRTSVPLWWIGLACPAGTLASAATGRAAPARVGLGTALVGLAAMADIWRSPTVPGANDNLSGVAGLVGLAELLGERPLPRLRVLLASCGAEESFQDGVRGFMERHAAELPVGRTWVLNLETIGSPKLALIEGEGPLVMRDYTDPEFRELVARRAESEQIALERDLRSRASTDSVIPSRAGYATATLSSVTDWRSLANYHWPSDVPENVDHDTVADAIRLAEAAVRRLDERWLDG
jgi:Zn-dependent M28 family amino/carboxypeptidase